MAYLQLSFIRPVPEQWQNLTDDQWAAKLGEVLAVVDKNGGSLQANALSPSHNMMAVAIVDYPDERAAMRAVAQVQALGTLEFDSIHHLWDTADYRAAISEAGG
jgi:uncharacterized protein with GYD domain